MSWIFSAVSYSKSALVIKYVLMSYIGIGCQIILYFFLSTYGIVNTMQFSVSYLSVTRVFYPYLFKELLGYNADIMCLQEVDNKIFDGDLNPVFSQNEYEGAFSVKGGVVTEGLACFWNSDKFEKLNGSRMVLAEAVLDDDSFTDILGALNINEALKENFLRRTTALQTVILKSKNHSEGLIIGNTHLFFKPDADHIRLLQTAMIVRQLEKIKTSAEKNFGMAFSVLLCGDFNSTPPFGVLEFMQQKVIKENHTDWCSAEGIVQFYNLI